MDSTSRWLGAWHSDSQKSVALCENVQVVPNLMFGAVKFPPNGPFEQWDELRTAPPHSRRPQAVAPKGGEGGRLRITQKSVPCENCCGLSKSCIQGWEIPTGWPTRTVRPALRGPAAPCEPTAGGQKRQNRGGKQGPRWQKITLLAKFRNQYRQFH